MRVAKALVYDGRGHVLVLRRSATHPAFAREADLPGGIIEDGESYKEGLAREIFEETGLTVSAATLTYLAQHDRFGLSVKRLYAARLPDSPAVTISWEHDAFEWVAPDKLAAALVSRDSYMAFARQTLAKQKEYS